MRAARIALLAAHGILGGLYGLWRRLVAAAELDARSQLDEELLLGGGPTLDRHLR